MTDRYAVMGNPVSHSLSPRIHTLFAQQTGQDLSYTAIRVEPGGLAAAIAAFRDQGGHGLNITVPFKHEACRLVDRLTPRAQRAGAVNTIRLEAGGAMTGDNTDGVGLVRDLTRNLGVTLTDGRILLLGAGGAASGVVEPLLGERPALMVIANRTAAKAVALADAFADLGPVFGCGLDDLPHTDFDVVLNATAASLEGEAPPLDPSILATGAAAYDLMYATEPTAFVRWAREAGTIRATDGLGMLVEQAAEAFSLWRGVHPDTTPVIATLNVDLGRPV